MTEKESASQITARCTVLYRVCMEEKNIKWQDCALSGNCGPPGVVTREDILAAEDRRRHKKIGGQGQLRP